jgi:hypothetical protein
MRSRMKRILYNVLLAVVWLAGGVFFLFLAFFIAISFLTKGLGKLLKRKEWYHFREQEFSALNVMHNSALNISIGKLPAVKGETFSYKVPSGAKEVLLEFKFNSYASDACLEFDYCLSGSSKLRKEFIYIFINPFDSMHLSYDKALVWYPVPADGILEVEFTDIKPVADSINNLEGQLNIVQVR